MARVLFLQEIAFDVLGVMYLSGYLKKNGHECDILIKTEEKKNFYPKIREYNPDLVAFSVTIGYQNYYMEEAEKIKNILDVPVIFGGPHLTYYPETIEHPAVDIICRGEGEEALLDLLNALDNGSDFSNIPNLWVKQNGSITQNDVRPGEENLDRYTPADRSIFYKYSYLRDKPLKTFFSGRGCPYQCSFCSNREYNLLYKGKMKMIRRVSPEKIVEEIDLCRQQYPLKRLYFDDDIFVIKKDWLADFSPLYRDKVGLPYACNVHVNVIDEEIVKLLKDSNCYLVMMGVETGNEKRRREILNKKITNKHIFDAADLFRKYGIEMKCFNLMGTPGETLEEALETVQINADLKVDHPWCNMLQTQPRTMIEEIAKGMGVLTEEFGLDSFSKSTAFFDSHLHQPDIERVTRLQRLFWFGVKMPWSIPFIKWLTKFPFDGLYKLLFALTFSYRFMRETRMPLSFMLRTVVRHKKAV